MLTSGVRLDTSFSYVISGFTALLAGVSMAGSGVLQQQAASRRPSAERLSVMLMRHLLTDRMWLLGILLAGLSYGFQAIALSFGPLALVQPLVVCEMLFAIPVSVRRHGLRLGGRDWWAVGAVVTGLVVGLVAAAPSQGNSIQPFGTWWPALVAAAVIAAATVLAAGWLEGPVRASVFAVGAGVVMAMQSALYAATIALLRQRGWALVGTWEPYALVIASILGLFLIQNAFQAGPLAASTPVLDATLPIVAVILGLWLFDEQVRASAWGYVGGLTGILLLIGGIFALDTSPVVRQEQQLEQAEQEETARREAVLALACARGREPVQPRKPVELPRLDCLDAQRPVARSRPRAAARAAGAVQGVKHDEPIDQRHTATARVSMGPSERHPASPVRWRL